MLTLDQIEEIIERGWLHNKDLPYPNAENKEKGTLAIQPGFEPGSEECGECDGLEWAVEGPTCNKFCSRDHDNYIWLSENNNKAERCQACLDAELTPERLYKMHADACREKEK